MLWGGEISRNDCLGKDLWEDLLSKRKGRNLIMWVVFLLTYNVKIL